LGFAKLRHYRRLKIIANFAVVARRIMRESRNCPNMPDDGRHFGIRITKNETIEKALTIKSLFFRIL
jgi:hypothetical protein